MCLGPSKELCVRVPLRREGAHPPHMDVGTDSSTTRPLLGAAEETINDGAPGSALGGLPGRTAARSIGGVPTAPLPVTTQPLRHNSALSEDGYGLLQNCEERRARGATPVTRRSTPPAEGNGYGLLENPERQLPVPQFLRRGVVPVEDGYGLLEDCDDQAGRRQNFQTPSRRGSGSEARVDGTLGAVRGRVGRAAAVPSATSSSLTMSAVDGARGPKSDAIAGADEVEMQSLATNSAAAQVLLPVAEGDKHCFICLDDDKDQELVSCCSTCFAFVHMTCWRDFRNSQRINALRGRLMGDRTETEHLLQCTICKSGTAVVEGEEDALEWMNDLLFASESRAGEGAAGPGDRANMSAIMSLHRREEVEDDAARLEETVDEKTCQACLAFAVVVCIASGFACALLLQSRLYAGDVVLVCLIGLYELSVVQLVALAVARRRLLALAVGSLRRERLGDSARGEHRGEEQLELPASLP